MEGNEEHRGRLATLPSKEGSVGTYLPKGASLGVKGVGIDYARSSDPGGKPSKISDMVDKPALISLGSEITIQRILGPLNCKGQSTGILCRILLAGILLFFCG